MTEPLQTQNYQMCVRCVIDTTVPGHNFDRDGVCQYCRLQERLEQEYPLGEEGEKRLNKIIATIKEQGKNHPFDCVTGIKW